MNDDKVLTFEIPISKNNNFLPKLNPSTITILKVGIPARSKNKDNAMCYEAIKQLELKFNKKSEKMR